MERTARCQCGEASITVGGEPALVTACHCTCCQRRSGSVVSVSSRWTEAQIIARTGALTRFARTGNSGGRVETGFCARCGSTLTTELDAMPGMLGIPVGAFADAHFPAPQVFAWCEHKPNWFVVPEDVPQLPQQTSPRR